jgi:hypothetical protein
VIRQTSVAAAAPRDGGFYDLAWMDDDFHAQISPLALERLTRT